MNPEAGGGAVRPFEFTGSGSGYFRIWIVNFALTILTLGIYSAWAKVRRLQYFYRNTSVAGSSFDFHGDPVAILKGRLIAVALLGGYNLAANFSAAFGLAMFAVLLVVFPWLVQRSLRFKLHNTSCRGLRFRFVGTVGEAYRAFLLWPFLGYITLFVLMPVAHREIKAYQHANSRFGDTPFGFNAGSGAFFTVYLKAFGMVVLAFVGLVGLFGIFGGLAAIGGTAHDKSKFIGLAFAAVVALYLLLFLMIGPWFAARMQNLVWNHTSLGPHGFASDVRARGLFFIYLTNFLGIVLSLGLYKPFADVRLARYRLSHLALVPDGDLEAFMAAHEQSVSAMGEEAADLFDVDISF